METITETWVIDALDFREDLYAAINRKRVEVSAKLRDEAARQGYDPHEYDIKVRHHPVDGGVEPPIVGVSSANITPKE